MIGKSIFLHNPNSGIQSQIRFISEDFSIYRKKDKQFIMKYVFDNQNKENGFVLESNYSSENLCSCFYQNSSVQKTCRIQYFWYQKIPSVICASSMEKTNSISKFWICFRLS